LPLPEVDSLIEGIIGFGGLVSRKTNQDGSISPYELNITYFDAMKGNQYGPDRLQEDRFISSQMIMMSMKGIPAFYIHSLLATPNDHEGIKATGRARSINRRQLKEEEIESSLSADTSQFRIFNRLVKLMEIRRNCSAFHPNCQQEVLHLEDSVFALVRFNNLTGQKVYCLSNMTSRPIEIKPEFLQKKTGSDLVSGDLITPSDPVLLNACQTKWIVQQENRLR
jgi:sucrose phosphorylase